MHELLLPASERPLDCAERYLRRRKGPHWRVLRTVGFSTLEADARPHVVVLAAWHELVRELTEEAATPPAESAQLELLTSELERALGPDSQTVIARLLQATVRRYGLAAMLLRGPLEERRRSMALGTFETRATLTRHARKIAQGEGRLYWRVALPQKNAQDERAEALVDNVCLALQLTHWLLRWKDDWKRGRLRFAVEDLHRHDIALADVGGSVDAASWNALCRDQIRWIRTFYAKGWPLCDEIGTRSGRALAFLLRWHAASLTALEGRRYRVDPPPPAGIPRAAACLAMSLATRAHPRLS